MSEEMFAGFDAENSVITREQLLKSLGLYWRTWPKEKPERDRKIHIRGRAFGLEDEGLARTAPDYHEFKDGDQWLYTEALEKLP